MQSLTPANKAKIKEKGRALAHRGEHRQEEATLEQEGEEEEGKGTAGPIHRPSWRMLADVHPVRRKGAEGVQNIRPKRHKMPETEAALGGGLLG